MDTGKDRETSSKSGPPQRKVLSQYKDAHIQHPDLFAKLHLARLPE